MLRPVQSNQTRGLHVIWEEGGDNEGSRDDTLGERCLEKIGGGFFLLSPAPLSHFHQVPEGRPVCGLIRWGRRREGQE